MNMASGTGCWPWPGAGHPRDHGDGHLSVSHGPGHADRLSPVGSRDLNEQGLTFLCSAGDFDALITGDMAGNTEKKLVERFDLPDIEVLVVGHHGSRYSSTDAFLQQMRPETAIISVGDNSYGHPTQEAMDRLSRNGAAVYRTDRQGNVLVTVNGGT